MHKFELKLRYLCDPNDVDGFYFAVSNTIQNVFQTRLYQFHELKKEATLDKIRDCIVSDYELRGFGFDLSSDNIEDWKIING